MALASVLQQALALYAKDRSETFKRVHYRIFYEVADETMSS